MAVQLLMQNFVVNFHVPGRLPTLLQDSCLQRGIGQALWHSSRHGSLSSYQGKLGVMAGP